MSDRDFLEAGRLAFPEMHRILQLLARFSPRQLRGRLNAKDPQYEEAVSPLKLQSISMERVRTWRAALVYHDVANVIIMERGRCQGKIPSYTLSIVPRIVYVPRPVFPVDRASDVSRWRNNSPHAKRGANPQAFPPNARLLYQMRCATRGGILAALSTVGVMRRS